MGIQDHEWQAAPRQGMADRQARLTAADDHGLDMHHVVGLTLGDLVAAGDVHAGEAIGELRIGSSPHVTRPCSIANSAAAARLENPILAYAFCTWRSAVLTEIPSAAATCFVW